MKVALAMIAAIFFFALGCGRPATPAVAAASARVPAPTLQLQPVTFLPDPVSSPETTNVIVQWDVLIAQFPVDAAGRLGVAKLFERIGEKNPVMDGQVAQSELAQIARLNSNIVLNMAAGAYAATCSSEDSTYLINRLTTTAGVDVISQPKLITGGTNHAIISVQNTITLVLGINVKSGSNAVITTNVSLGPTVSLHLVNRTEDRITFEAAARLEEFGGYEPATNDTPHPVLNLVTMGTRAELKTNEVLILGGPKRMSVSKTVERVAYLSAIPAIGSLFTKTQMHTNFVRTLVMIRPRVL
jgi:Flp pilus assembly secretin CpaC